jgi:uncharacterized protein (TIGR03083 family)
MGYPGLEYSAYVDAIRREGAAFVAAARAAGVDARVPSCPDWTVADLCSHVGRLHRWATEIVEARPAGPTRRWTNLDAPEGPALVDFVAQGYGPLADALGRARADETCWTWVDEQTVHFWARRQANELAIHRRDVQGAAGTTEPIDGPLAVDGIQELFDILPFRPGGPPTGNGETIHLHCTDGEGEWLIRLDPDGVSAVNEHAKGDVAARGSASDLLLVMWGRIPVDSVEVFGDASLLERWSDGKL